ncbi:MAG: sigma-70 family RNA polymerase sigma factor [Vicinamibacterales bacterium]|jgi:RNA polymerase sigma-70 factor (ECF subfamily)|nr:sigma-70 family RNA polymerase sigma factor [Vicinamibacterales bacterium]
MTAFTDDHLPAGTVSRARDGCIASREAIYRAFELPVRTLARRLVPESRQAEDLAQDVFVEVLTSLDQYEGRGSFAGWVRAITVRACLMHLRSPWRRALRWARAADGDVTEAVTPVEPATSGEAVDLERALARLGDTARAVVWLHDVEGYTHAEIGALLGGSVSFSKSQLARAHARLRELLEPEGVKSSCMPVSTNC